MLPLLFFLLPSSSRYLVKREDREEGLKEMRHHGGVVQTWEGDL